MDTKDIQKIINNSITELTEDINKGYSDRIIKYFEWKAKFHKYSFWNTVMIQLQRPNATHVKGYVQWKKFGYPVKKGSKAISIFAPQTAKYIYRPGEKFEKTFWKDMTELERKRPSKHKTLSYFRSVNVFDIKDTDCKDHPTFFMDLGNSHKEIYETVFDRFFSEVTIVEDSTTGASYFDIANKQIILKMQDYNNKLLALIHELAHFHCDKDIKNYRGTYNYQEGEIHAESISFIVCKFLSIDNPFSKDYIINWKGSVDKIKEHLQVIDTISTNIINIIEKEDHAAEERFCQGRKA